MVPLKTRLLFHASAIAFLVHAGIAVAPLKVKAMFFTLRMSHESNPAPVNLAALRNVANSVVTVPTFHALRSAFISVAP